MNFFACRCAASCGASRRKSGITFIHVTHTQMEAVALADLVVVMDQGQIEQAAPAREVYDLPRTGYVARFMGGQNVLSGTVVSRAANTVTIKTGPKQVMLTASDRGAAPAPISKRRCGATTSA